MLSLPATRGFYSSLYEISGLLYWLLNTSLGDYHSAMQRHYYLAEVLEVLADFMDSSDYAQHGPAFCLKTIP